MKAKLKKDQSHLRLKKGDIVEVKEWKYDDVYQGDTMLLVEHNVWLPVSELEL